MDKFVPIWLRGNLLAEYCTVFERNKIDKRRLLMIDREFAKELIPVLGDRMDFLVALEKLKNGRPEKPVIVLNRPPANENLLIIAKWMDGGENKVVMKPTSTIEELKKEISAKWNFEEERKCPVKKETMSEDLIRLIFNGKQLEDGRTLNDYGFKNGDMTHVVKRMCGC